MPDELKVFVNDLEREAIEARCYIGWTAAGLAVGSLAAVGLGTALGGLAGLLYASKTCKPIVNKIKPKISQTGRFITPEELGKFHAELQKITPVTQDEAHRLAVIVYKSGALKNLGNSSLRNKHSPQELKSGILSILKTTRAVRA